MVKTKSTKKSKRPGGPVVQKQTTKPKAKAKEKLQLTNKSSQKKSKKSNTSETTTYKEKVLSAKQRDQWGPIKQPTNKFVSCLIDSCIDKVLGLTPSSSQREAKDVLDELRQRLAQNLQTIKVPSKATGDYFKTQREGRQLKTQRAELEQQEETLNDAIDAQDKMTEVARAKLRRLKITCDSSKVRKTLFHKNEDDSPKLEYPDYDSVELMQEND